MMGNMKKILVVQSRSDPTRIEREAERFRIAVGTSAEVDFLSSVDEKLAWTTPDEMKDIVRLWQQLQEEIEGGPL